MLHYNLLKLRHGADADQIFQRCCVAYSRLEKELDFLHDVQVRRCATCRDSNADIMMVMRIDEPKQLSAYLQHPEHLALVQEMQCDVIDRMSFDLDDKITM